MVGSILGVELILIVAELVGSRGEKHSPNSFLLLE